MTLEIKGYGKGILDIKRCWLDGIESKQTCPECGTETEWDDFDGDSYNYPEMGEWVRFDMYCGECDREWTEEIKLNVSIEVKHEHR